MALFERRNQFDKPKTKQAEPEIDHQAKVESIHRVTTTFR